jgi:hypothetical protein
VNLQRERGCEEEEEGNAKKQHNTTLLLPLSYKVLKIQFFDLICEYFDGWILISGLLDGGFRRDLLDGCDL